MSRAENILYFAAAAMKEESILLVSLHFWTKLVLLWRAACYHTTGACIVLFWGGPFITHSAVMALQRVSVAR